MAVPELYDITDEEDNDTSIAKGDDISIAKGDDTRIVDEIYDAFWDVHEQSMNSTHIAAGRKTNIKEIEATEQRKRKSKALLATAGVAILAFFAYQRSRMGRRKGAKLPKVSSK